ncbi:hypothetical protein O159_10700 [Leifsonia xyli subsp. cynodontis DSM 46306]|uniref:DUF1023 domain-containing protein n=1 Tax=Leifsonia xyli subsp. cynodontis DSM 46306 TaxID=1389489 RepID=U3PCB9_LEIXC|nr:alpha/beta hydrolase [Leifsonia xyli]AGW41173.1 hypothetical protein O159_10700 [Leifsonia xyli subsp. cynodontis DSM 46306]
MLVGFAAFSFVASVVSGPTGAVGVASGLPAQLTAGPSASLVASGLSPVGDPANSGSVPGVVPAAVRPSLLSSIQTVDPAALPGFLSAHAVEVDQILARPPAAADVAQLWRFLDPARQSALLQSGPHLVGNLEGIPYSVRGKANTLDLGRTIASAERRLRTERGKSERIVLQRRLDTLGNVKAALVRKDGVKRTLVALDPAGDARAVIVVGDLSTASYVSVLVPGMYMSVGEQIGSWTTVAQELHDRQSAYLKSLSGGHGAPGVAVVAWIGYQTPVLMNIGSLKLAEQGADSLGRTLEGIRSLRAGDQPYLCVFAHSYGSTAALLALERHTVTVDALALMGSPGSDAQSVEDLSVANGNVYVGEAPMDPIVDSAFFGSDPGSPFYGAQSMGVEGALDPITHETLAGSSGHNEYFMPGTESMRNLAMIGIDKGGLVIPASGSLSSTQAVRNR